MTFSPVNLELVNLAGTDQFTPAVGIAEGGDIVLAWYDRSGATTEYQERIVELTPASVEVMRAAPGPVCQAATVGEYQGLARVPAAAGGGWQLAWSCSDPEAGGRTILQTAKP
jgi:hypothetical protein